MTLLKFIDLYIDFNFKDTFDINFINPRMFTHCDSCYEKVVK